MALATPAAAHRPARRPDTMDRRVTMAKSGPGDTSATAWIVRTSSRVCRNMATPGTGRKRFSIIAQTRRPAYLTAPAVSVQVFGVDEFRHAPAEAQGKQPQRQADRQRAARDGFLVQFERQAADVQGARDDGYRGVEFGAEQQRDFVAQHVAQHAAHAARDHARDDGDAPG